MTSAEPIIPDGKLAWAPDSRIKKAERIAPFPHDPDRVWVTTEAGIMQTTDDGATWNLMPGTSRAEIGRITDVLFSPFDLTTVFIGTRDKGILRSDDAGKTWKPIGTPETGVASLQVNKIRIPPSDWALRAIYATHGEVAGLSRSGDGGAHWTNCSNEFFCEDLLFVNTVMVMNGARKSEEDIRSVFKSVDGGQLWADEKRDLPVSLLAAPQIKQWPQFGAVLKGGIVDTDSFRQKGPEQGGRWASLFTTFEGNGDQEILYAYDPYKHGLIASKDGFATWRRENEGLFVGPLVKEGAHVCCNANGTTFYALINGQVYVGRNFSGNGSQISSAKITPGVFKVPSDAHFKTLVQQNKEWPAQNLTMTVSARITPAEGAKIKRVDAHLEPLHLNPIQLFDDGKHNDGGANDGLYAGHFVAGPNCILDPHARPKLPGQTTCFVTALDDKNRTSSSVIAVSVYPMHEPWPLWDGDGNRWGGPMTCFQPITAKGRVQELEVGAHTGQRCLRFISTGGSWAIGWGQDYYGKNASVPDYLTFWMKLTAPADRDIKCFLFDGRGGERMANPSNEVWLIKDGYVKPGVKEYQLVKIPMDKFRSKPGFFYEVLGGIAFGGESEKGTEFFIDDVGFE